MAIVARQGIPGLTMQGVADDVGCSVGTVYTHFASKGVLVADLQDLSIQRIVASYQAICARSAARLDEAGADAPARAAAGLVLFGEFFVACWDAYPEESHLLFAVLAERGEVLPRRELGRVLGSTLVLLALGQETMEGGSTAGVVDEGPAMDRVVVGASAMLGVLLTSHLNHIDPGAFDHSRLARTAWRDLVRGWGMAEERYLQAESHVRRLAADGSLAPAA